MRLVTLVPALPERLVAALENCGIRTDTDLLFNSGTAMQIYEKLPPEIVTLAQLERYISDVAGLASAPILDGVDVLNQEEQCRAAFVPFSTGVPQLDELINGRNGPKVLEVSGDHGTGKTLLALQVVMRQLSTHADHAALWIDTTGDFSVDRIHLISAAYDKMPSAHSAAERLQLSLAFDVNTVQEVLESLRTSYSLSGSTKIRCLVIDSITTLFRPVLSVVSSQGHAMMASFMQQLRSFAEAYSLIILVLNSTSSAAPQNPNSAFVTTTRKPALGPSFTCMTDATLWLSKATGISAVEPHGDGESNNIYAAEILRSKYTPSKTWCSYKVFKGILQVM
ncbi:P-loop containing nucleoside triphosphate hydrolase protein [Cytidiella melzeri]|nr:P-loop containing nucleoside triphosphate hydrolase protein [Cytidiella melzeri]